MPATRSRSPLGGGRTQNATPNGVPQGTPGGRSAKKAVRGSRSLKAGVNDPTMYLWVLVLLEALLMGYLRHHMRRYHGG